MPAPTAHHIRATGVPNGYTEEPCVRAREHVCVLVCVCKGMHALYKAWPLSAVSICGEIRQTFRTTLPPPHTHTYTPPHTSTQTHTHKHIHKHTLTHLKHCVPRYITHGIAVAAVIEKKSQDTRDGAMRQIRRQSVETNMPIDPCRTIGRVRYIKVHSRGAHDVGTVQMDTYAQFTCQLELDEIFGGGGRVCV